MVYRRRRRNRRRAPSYRRRRRFYRRTMRRTRRSGYAYTRSLRVPRSILSKSIVVKLLFQDSRPSNSLAPNYWALRYNLNGLYDAYSSGIGGSPNGFTRWHAFYKSNLVLGAKITWQFDPETTAEQILTAALVARHSVNSNVETAEELFEQPSALSKTIMSNNTATSPRRFYTLSKYFSIRKLVNRYTTDNSNLVGYVGSNPTHLVPCYLLMRDPTVGSQPSINCNMTVRIKFYVRFFDPIWHENR